MNSEQLRESIRQLDDRALQDILQGKVLILGQDTRLGIGDPGHPQALFQAVPAPAGESPASLKESLLDQAGDLLEHYYRRHPLGETAFRQQVEALFERHGAGAFTALPGERPLFTLFVEGGAVIAEDRSNPRHPYGTYCELVHETDEAQRIARARQWLAGGEAHAAYLSMNVCRYNC